MQRNYHHKGLGILGTKVIYFEKNTMVCIYQTRNTFRIFLINILVFSQESFLNYKERRYFFGFDTLINILNKQKIHYIKNINKSFLVIVSLLRSCVFFLF